MLGATHYDIVFGSSNHHLSGLHSYLLTPHLTISSRRIHEFVRCLHIQAKATLFSLFSSQWNLILAHSFFTCDGLLKIVFNKRHLKKSFATSNTLILRWLTKKLIYLTWSCLVLEGDQCLERGGCFDLPLLIVYNSCNYDS